uniref:Uncharacterized protein n=1 Tax=Ananas comosus var. bracteatus TaxID=296719 RepID=A0A6V7Q2U3_ANACO|nr:unnamed protein product [Ananas comosus var. bracteatus]
MANEQGCGNKLLAIIKALKKHYKVLGMLIKTGGAVEAACSTATSTQACPQCPKRLRGFNKIGSTAEAAKNTTHNSKESIDYNLIEGAAPSEQMKTQGLSEEYGEEFITERQCENSSLHRLPAQKKGALGAESETAKEGCEPQQVEEGNAYDAVSIKESNNQALLSLVDDRSLHSLIDFGTAKATKVGSTTFAPLIVIADRDPKMLSKDSCPQFARKKPGYKFLADSRELRLKSSDIALRIDWMKKYRQVPFDPGPNKVTFRSIEGEASHKFIMTSKLQKVIHQKTQGMLGQSAMIRIGEMAKAITTEGCKRVNSIGLIGTVEGLNKHIQRRPIEAYQESIENSRIQTLLRNSSLEEAYIAYSLVNGCKELGSVLKMPHPCSRFLAYEQDKLQESDVSDCNFHNANYVHSVMIIDNSFLSLVESQVHHENGEDQDVRELEDETSCSLIIARMVMKRFAYKKWCDGLYRRKVSKDCSALKKKANGKQNEATSEDNREITARGKILKPTSNQIGLYHISRQTSRAARRLRLPKGPKGEPPPQQEPPSMLPTRGVRRVWTQLETPHTGAKGGQENRTDIRKWLKRSNFEEEECAAREANGSPKPVQQVPSLRTRMILRGGDCNNPEE